MPYCPKCRAEFREGFSMCNTCGVPLIAGEVPKKNEKKEAGEPVCIHTVNDTFQANQILALLKDNDIVAYIRGSGASDYITIYYGYSNLGTSIYVDKNDAERAKELIEVFLGSNFEQETDFDDLILPQNKRSPRTSRPRRLRTEYCNNS